MEKKLKNSCRILGLMSGTSLDGLDMALCEFESAENSYSYKIIKATTTNYTHEWRKLLADANTLTTENYFKLNALYGKFIAEQVIDFLTTHSLSIDAIASHGHTIFHQPHLGFSTQLGCGATIAANTGKVTICDFRSVDVAFGGQGAPLVPIGDKLLFNHYDACLNIGGIANISFDNETGQRIAYDVCEANMLLNYLSEKIGKPFDENGEIAKSGTVKPELLTALNSLAYYSQSGAKSIGREWFESNFLNLLNDNAVETKDLLATATEHVAQILANDLNKNTTQKVLITGGGAFNKHLIEKIKSKTNCEIIIPDAETINFKEALIFAFLGYLRLKEKINTLSSVTGAKTDSIGGAIYLGG